MSSMRSMSTASSARPALSVLDSYLSQIQVACPAGESVADVLAQVAWSAVFTIADHGPSPGGLDAHAATTSSLLLLGVPADRAAAFLPDAP